jgi:hypothetical protein
MKRTTHKLLQPQTGLVLAWAGYKDVAQAMVLSLSENPIDLEEPRSQIAGGLSRRFREIRDDRSVEHRSDFNEFLFGWFRRLEAKPVALHLHSGGATEWVEEWQFGGNQSAVATARTVEASISYIAVENLGAEQLSLVVLKVLRDSIAAAPPTAGIGGEIKLATVAANGVHLLEAAELRAGNDALDVWQEQCAELLPGASARPADREPADRGLRPPS